MRHSSQGELTYKVEKKPFEAFNQRIEEGE